MSTAQQQAIQTAQRQQRISNEYTKATGNKGKPKTKEGKNIFRNWWSGLQETITKFCTTSDKVKTQKSSVVALLPGIAWGLPQLKKTALPTGAKVVGKSLVKVAGKALWVITTIDLSNKVVNYFEHGDTNDLVVGGDITPKDIADRKVKELLDKTYPKEKNSKNKGPTTQRGKKGNYDDTLNDFDDLKLKDVKGIQVKDKAGKVGYLEDGRKVVARPQVDDKDPTLEIQENNSRDRTKIRYEKE